jgi:hypothetical protein
MRRVRRWILFRIDPSAPQRQPFTEKASGDISSLHDVVKSGARAGLCGTAPFNAPADA